MKNNILALSFLFFFCAAYGQKNLTWDDLSDVKFTEKYNEKFKADFLFPEFGPSVKALEGKEISIIGYFLNIDPRGDVFMISKGPMSSCFFCGVGGPETAMELEFDNKQNFKTDNLVIATGILKLNADDVEHFNYILQNCEVAPLK